jgi:hypothetical protein
MAYLRTANNDGVGETYLRVLVDGLTGTSYSSIVIYNATTGQSYNASYEGAGRSTVQTFGGLTPGNSYSFYAEATPTGSTARRIPDSGFDVFATKNPPAKFAWTNAKSAGAMYNLTAAEWGAFLDKINEFRVYKGLTTYTFSRGISSGAITSYIVPTANSFNTAINAINGMSPTISTPAYVSSGDIITAYQLNRMRDALNSIT